VRRCNRQAIFDLRQFFPQRASFLFGRVRILSIRTRVTSWMAIAAILLAAFAPSLSAAFGVGKAPSWIEVCTAQGSNWVLANGDVGDEQAPAHGHSLDQCPYCSLHTPGLETPPTGLHSILRVDLAHAAPLAFLPSPRVVHARLSAQPRAPPLFS
jgi:hypothetical protein